MYSSLGFQDVNRPKTCHSSVFCTNARYYYTMHGARKAGETERLYDLSSRLVTVEWECNMLNRVFKTTLQL